MDDLIKRQAAIDAFEKHSHLDWERLKILYPLLEEIEQLPSVSMEKTGHGIFVQYDFDPRIGNWHCSECRNIIFQGVEKKGIHNEVIYKFCPNCGARMIKSEGEE